MYEKEKLSSSSHSALVARSGPYGKKNHGKNMVCWKCEKSGHVKKNYPSGAKGADSEARTVFLVIGEDDVPI